MSKYNRNIIGTLANGEPESVQVDVYSVLNAFEVTCPVMQHIVKKALCTGLRGHKSKTQDLIDIKDSALRALDIERHGNKAQRELHRKQLGHIHSLTVPGSISDAGHTLTPHVHECSGGQHRQSLVVPSGRMHRPETMDGHHIHPPIGSVTPVNEQYAAAKKIIESVRAKRVEKEVAVVGAIQACQLLSARGWYDAACDFSNLVIDKMDGKTLVTDSAVLTMMAHHRDSVKDDKSASEALETLRKYLGIGMHKP